MRIWMALVNDDDVTIVGAAYAPGLPQPQWAMGDFNYNGFVDDDDVTLLGAFYERTAAGPPAAAKYDVQSTRHGGQAAGEAGTAAAPPVISGGVSGEWSSNAEGESRAELARVLAFVDNEADDDLVEPLAESIAAEVAGHGESVGDTRRMRDKPTGTAYQFWPN